MANSFVVADPSVCIGCKTCMAACLSKHDVPNDVAEARLNLVCTLDISAPIVCHHCQDAPCVAVCPTHALHFDENRVAVSAEKCIGCQGCVMACPYGAVSVTTRKVTQSLGNLEIPVAERAMVVKCDLCADRKGGPACIEACPTKGLMLVDETELNNLSKARKRKSAEALKQM